MKNCFIAVRRVIDQAPEAEAAVGKKANGKKATNGNGKTVGPVSTFHFERHPHKCLANKEFTSITEAIQAVNDHQNNSRPQIILDQASALIAAGEQDAAIALLASMKPVSIGEVILLNVLEF